MQAWRQLTSDKLEGLGNELVAVLVVGHDCDWGRCKGGCGGNGGGGSGDGSQAAGAVVRLACPQLRLVHAQFARRFPGMPPRRPSTSSVLRF